ncbi:putative leucine-rich repeat receptor-like protein kinase At2g19210 [Gastrolobium bilobum]|uniref:putative leucine-rich repeat receptor-like protein kinase At2g19210 n=1 Tax=Gastrolobium bilobum TaxID=150636 RepID=UPI002AB08838|nr:putative leucine-rich repeat receptor-like protein kinase At2g19210 [Gastrolobium bilobum]
MFWFVLASVYAIAEFNGKSIVMATEKNSMHHKQGRRKLDDVAGSICIDCGLSGDLKYTDDETRIDYTSDTGFIDTGTNKNISVKFIPEIAQRTFKTVRSFPQGKRNCYTLRHPEGKDTIYLIRATFMYGNYDELNQLPQFDLYIGVNLWDSVRFDNSTHVVIKEILHVPSMDNLYVCLLNTDLGTPFISALEVRHFDYSIYRTKSGPLALYRRFDIGSTTDEIVRFDKDYYDRMWFPYNLPDCTPLNTSFTIDSLNHTKYHLPSTAMRTAVRPKNDNDSLEFEFDTGYPTSESYVYMHFAEIEDLQENEKREFDITLNGKLWAESVTPMYLHSTTIDSEQSIRGNKLMFSMHKKPYSTHPPILNAMEIYIVKDFLQAPTDQEDVKAIMEIKSHYMSTSLLGKSWQGDPCAPLKYSWNGLNCSNNGYDSPRITALNLASSALGGTIIASFLELKFLESLDLSNNSLTGPMPDFSQLQYLKALNLSGNKLSGEIPSLLKERSNNGSLLLSVDGYPDLCLMAPCQEDKKNIVPLVAVILSSVVFLIVLGTALTIIWRWRCNRKPASKQAVRSSEEIVLKSNNKQFTYSQIVAITNDFEKMIGKGGCGIVYHGSLNNGTQVAVKMVLPKSPQGSQQFQTEAELLMRVHHKNLASFLGYCNDVGHSAIIYEYMAYGNIEEYLSDAKREPLSWRHRIQIAVDAAQGLEYLHHGCKPPIIHRDIKTANILLNEKMQAKVADFGFSKLFPTENESHILTAVVGTFGYLDPEYYTSSRLTEKSDVYSFGIVLLELITGQQAIIKGRENTHIVKWVSHFLARGDIQQIVDPRMQGDFDFGSMWKAAEAAIACVPSISIQRPSMSYIVTELKECLEMEAAREQEGTNEQISKSNSFEMSVVDLEADYGPGAR